MLTLTDDPPHSGLRFAALAAIASALGAREASVPPRQPGDTAGDCQHVTASGALVANGIIHLERAGLAVRLDPSAKQSLPETPADSGLADVRSTRWAEDGAALLNGRGEPVAHLFVDRFGRAHLTSATLGKPPPNALRIAIAGRRSAVRNYPAVAMALADAADHLSCGVTLACLEPNAGRTPEIDGLDGLILPGGADMSVLPHLVGLASATRAAGLPTLGLCLGYQAMAISAARGTEGWASATTEEVAQSGERLVFSRHFADGAPHHRLGPVDVHIPAAVAGQLGLPQTWQERMNHRYAMTAEAADLLAGNGLMIARSQCGVVDALADPAQPFWFGSEGHAELTSSPGAPHPVFMAFLRAAIRPHLAGSLRA